MRETTLRLGLAWDNPELKPSGGPVTTVVAGTPLSRKDKSIFPALTFPQGKFKLPHSRVPDFVGMA